MITHVLNVLPPRDAFDPYPPEYFLRKSKVENWAFIEDCIARKLFHITRGHQPPLPNYLNATYVYHKFRGEANICTECGLLKSDWLLMQHPRPGCEGREK